MNTEILKEITEKYISEHDIQALSLCIEKDQNILFEMSWGKTAKEGRKVKKDTLFTIGSVSKTFTAAAVLILKDQGKLQLDQKVCELMPEFTMKDERYKNITVRMLLNHSAGFYGNTPRGKYTLTPNRDYLPQVLDFMSESTLKDEPGKYSVYCNDCFAVAEALIETISGMSYSEFIEEAILEPLGMIHTEFPEHEIREGRIVYAKSPYDTDYPQEYVNGIGSGGIYSTAEDLCIFMNALAQGRLLSKASQEEMNKLQTPQKMEIEKIAGDLYGLGWDTIDLNIMRLFNKKAMAKSGSTYGFGSYVICCPEENLCAAIVMSMTEGSPSALLKKLIYTVMEKLGHQKTVSVFSNLPEPKERSGIYGNNSTAITVKEEGCVLSIEDINTKKTWTFVKKDNKWHCDESFYGKDKPSLIFVECEGIIYMLIESAQALLDDVIQRSLFAQKISLSNTEYKVSYANKTYIMDNEYPTQRCLDHLPMILEIKQIENLLLVPYPLIIEDGKHASSFIELPGNNSREMVPFLGNEDGSFTLGMYHYQPLSEVKPLTNTEFKIENQKTAWFIGNNSLDNIKMDGQGRCIMLDKNGNAVFDSELSWSMPEKLDNLYIGFTGSEGTKITIEISE